MKSQGKTCNFSWSRNRAVTIGVTEKAQQFQSGNSCNPNSRNSNPTREILAVDSHAYALRNVFHPLYIYIGYIGYIVTSVINQRFARNLCRNRNNNGSNTSAVAAQ